MFTTGSKLLIGSQRRRRRRRHALRRHPEGHARHDRTDLGGRRPRVARRDQHLRSRLQRVGDGHRRPCHARRPPAARPTPACGRCRRSRRDDAGRRCCHVPGDHDPRPHRAAGGGRRVDGAGWSERASADRAYNTGSATGSPHPLELPILGAVGAGVIIYSFSRVMLGLPSKSAPSSPSWSSPRSCCSSAR